VLSKEIIGTGYMHAVSINPMLPNTAYDIKRADESFRYDAFRIYPTLHGYDFDTPQFTEFYHMASHKGKPLFIHCLFGDPRLDYLLKQLLFESESLGLFLKAGHSIPVVLCNIRLNDIYAMAPYAGQNNNIYYDMSELRHSMFAIDDLSKAGLVDRMVFGSLYPVFDFKAAYIHLDGVEDSIKNKILNRRI
jgi:predicted TIM-barrel fold metal-dependent hydrolase